MAVDKFSLQVLINGVDKTSKIQRQDFIIENSLNNRASTCNFTVLDYSGSYVPTINSNVKVKINGAVYFDGFLKIYNISYDGIGRILQMEAKDNTDLTDRMIVTEKYENMTVNQIFNQLFIDYPDLTTNGLTKNNVNCGILFKTVAFNSISMSKVIQQLADATNYNWYIDENRDIHFFIGSESSAPFNITKTSDTCIQGTLSITNDVTQAKNVVWVRGGDATSTTTKDYLQKGDGSKKIFNTGYIYAQLPTVTLNSTVQTVGVDNLDSDSSFQVMWNFTSQTIRFTTYTPLATDLITITGFYNYPIIVVKSDPSSVSALGGKYEYKLINKTIRTKEEASQYATGQLDNYSKSVDNGSFSTYKTGLNVGQSIHITYDGIDRTFVIERIDMRIHANSSTNQYSAIFNVQVTTQNTTDMIQLLQKLVSQNDDVLELGGDEVIEKIQWIKESTTINEGFVIGTLDISVMTSVCGPYRRTGASDTKIGGIVGKSKFS